MSSQVIFFCFFVLFGFVCSSEVFNELFDPCKTGFDDVLFSWVFIGPLETAFKSDEVVSIGYVPFFRAGVASSPANFSPICPTSLTTKPIIFVHGMY